MKKLLLLALTLLISFITLPAQTLDDILERHIKASGGQDEFAHLKSAYIESTVTVSGIVIKERTTVLKDTGVRIEQDIMGMKFIRGYDGKTGWTQNPVMNGGNAARLPDSLTTPMLAQMNLSGLFIKKEKGTQLEYKGEDTFQDEPVYLLELKMSDVATKTHSISQKTYLIVRTVIRLTTESGNVIETNIIPSNYQTVDGFTTPMTMVTTGGGMPTSVRTDITSVKYNVDVDPAIFRLPEE